MADVDEADDELLIAIPDNLDAVLGQLDALQASEEADPDALDVATQLCAQAWQKTLQAVDVARSFLICGSTTTGLTSLLGV